MYVLPFANTDYSVQIRPINFAHRNVRFDESYEGTNQSRSICSGQCQHLSLNKFRGIERSRLKMAMCKANSNTPFQDGGGDAMIKRCNEEAQHCELNQRKPIHVSGSRAVGPFRVMVQRQARMRNTTTMDAISQKVVCQFAFSYDTFMCRGHTNSTYCGSGNGYDTGDTAEPWSNNMDTIQSTAFNPILQTPGHNCKAWFLVAQRTISGLLNLASTIRSMGAMKKCDGMNDSRLYANDFNITGIDVPTNRTRNNGQCPKSVVKVPLRA